MCVNVYGNEVGRELLKETWTAQSLSGKCTLTSVFRIPQENIKLYASAMNRWCWKFMLFEENQFKKYSGYQQMVWKPPKTRSPSTFVCFFRICRSLFYSFDWNVSCDAERWWSFHFVMTMRACQLWDIYGIQYEWFTSLLGSLNV